MVRAGAAIPRPRRTELIAALSLAIDLGLGQPMEHMLRSCLIAMRLGDLVGADPDDRDTVYYGGLLAWIGCHADSQEFAELLGDDIAFRAASYDVDWRGPEFAALLMRYVGSVRPLPARAVRLLDFVVHARPQLTSMIASHCVSASALATRLGLPDQVIEGLAFTFERWDGTGLPTRAHGDAIPLGMRLVHLADVAEVHLPRGGPDAAIAVARRRRGTQFDPHLVDVFCQHVTELDPGDDDVWDAVIALAPDASVPLDAAEVDRVLEAMGDFVDLKSPWTVGHSRAVAALAVRAGRSLALWKPELTNVARAGRVMDLGLMGVPNRVWRKTTTLAPAEEEWVRLHPYLTRRILSRVPALEPLSRLASSHHERLDGTGYPQGATAPQLGLPERILAAAEEYRSLREPHPLRPALAPADAARSLRGDVRAGRLDGPAAEAVLAAAGNRPTGRPAWPAGLTGREVTVLQGIARAGRRRRSAPSCTSRRRLRGTTSSTSTSRSAPPTAPLPRSSPSRTACSETPSEAPGAEDEVIAPCGGGPGGARFRGPKRTKEAAMTTVRDLAMQTEERDGPTPGPDERFGGYTVMGLPFANGHYLAFRRLPANPFGRPYSSVWHRDPDGAWTFYVDAPADESCPRFFDAGLRTSVRTPIDVSWPGPSHLRVEVPGTVTWDLEFGSTAATAALSAAARATPARLMASAPVLAMMGRMAGPMLRTGRMRMAGTTPNGQWFRAEPTKLWSVTASTAVLEGTNLGTPGPLPEQAHLADVWLPQRGVLMLGGAVFEAFDPSRHHSARPALATART